MAKSSKYRVCLVPRDFASSEELLYVTKAFQTIRLQGLRSDPASFSSSEFIERQRPLSFFTKRLRNPLAKTFAIVCDSAEKSSPKQAGEPTTDTWYGMLVLLGPQVIDPQRFDDKESWKNLIGEQRPASQDSQPDITIRNPSLTQMALSYHIVSVYVSSNLRGQGLGKDLFRAAFAEIEKEAAKNGLTRAICTLGVGKDATAAWNLYSAMGFVAVAEDSYTSDDGRVIDDVMMRKDLKRTPRFESLPWKSMYLLDNRSSDSKESLVNLGMLSLRSIWPALKTD